MGDNASKFALESVRWKEWMTLNVNVSPISPNINVYHSMWRNRWTSNSFFDILKWAKIWRKMMEILFQSDRYARKYTHTQAIRMRKTVISEQAFGAFGRTLALYFQKEFRYSLVFFRFFFSWYVPFHSSDLSHSRTTNNTHTHNMCVTSIYPTGNR